MDNRSQHPPGPKAALEEAAHSFALAASTPKGQEAFRRVLAVAADIHGVEFQKDCGLFAEGDAQAEKLATEISGYHIEKEGRHFACSRATAMRLLDDLDFTIVSTPNTPGRSRGTGVPPVSVTTVPVVDGGQA